MLKLIINLWYSVYHVWGHSFDILPCFRYPALSSEMFTTLLEPEHPPTSIGQGACRDYPALEYEDGWWGGTAVITAVAGATPSLYLALVFNGVFPKTAVTSHLVRVILTLPEKNQTIIDQVYSYLFILF